MSSRRHGWVFHWLGASTAAPASARARSSESAGDQAGASTAAVPPAFRLAVSPKRHGGASPRTRRLRRPPSGNVCDREPRPSAPGWTAHAGPPRRSAHGRQIGGRSGQRQPESPKPVAPEPRAAAFLAAPARRPLAFPRDSDAVYHRFVPGLRGPAPAAARLRRGAAAGARLGKCSRRRGARDESADHQHAAPAPLR